MTTVSLSTKLQGIREFETRVRALAAEVQVEILDPFEDEDAVAKVHISERTLKNAIQDIALDIQDRTGVRIVPLILYKWSSAT